MRVRVSNISLKLYTFRVKENLNVPEYVGYK